MLIRWLALGILAIGLLRLFGFAGHQPLWGYANQYDMARTSACLGLWPDRPDGAFDAAHPSAPLPVYRSGGPRSEACFPSAEVAVVASAVWLHQMGGADAESAFSLRWLALWKAILATLTALSLHLGLRHNPGWQLGFSIAFAGIVCDPFNLLYLAGLYTEFTALLGAWLATGTLVMLVLRRRSGQDIGWLAPLGLAAGLLVLGTARMQHVLHPLALLTLLGVFWWRTPAHRASPRVGGGRTWAPLLPAIIAVIAVIGLQAYNQQQQRAVADANRINSLFAALLPASDEPRQMIRRMGLPEHCVALNHVSWYRHQGHKPLQACPEVSRYSRLRGLWALMHEPVAVLRLLGRGLLHSSAWRLPYLGEVVGESFARAPSASIVTALAGLGFVSLILLWATPLLPVVVLSRRLIRGCADSLDVVGLLLMTWIGLAWIASLLGDGYSELARHLHLAQNALLALWLWLPCWLWSCMPGLAHRSGGPRFRRVGLSAAAFLGLLLLANLWSRIPVATGLLAFPDGASRVGNDFAVRGWVLASSQVSAVRAQLGGATPVPLTLDPADEALRNHFTAGDGQLVANFTGELSWPDSGEPSAVLRIEARDESTQWREITAVLLQREPEPTVMSNERGER